MAGVRWCPVPEIGMPFAPRSRGQLAVFQGASDERPAPVFARLLVGVSPVRAKLVRDVKNESRGRGTEERPTGLGPEGCDENGRAGSPSRPVLR